MKLSESMADSLAENLEMQVFSSEVTATGGELDEEHSFDQGDPEPPRHLEHPLAPVCEEDPETEAQLQVQVQVQVQVQNQEKAESQSASPAKPKAEPGPPTLHITEEIEIEMEVFPPLRVSDSELVEIESDHPSIMTPPSQTSSPKKVSRVRWRKVAQQTTGLVVKDVVCLPQQHYLAQMERHMVPRAKDRAALSALGLTARISIDGSWSPAQMESRMLALFRPRFVTQKGQRFSFTYLQCVQGSRVLFVPERPAEGWSGEQVLKICRNEPLYILSHLEQPSTDPECTPSQTSAANKKEFCSKATADSRQEEEHQRQSPLQEDTELTVMDLESLLRRFREENVDASAETRVEARRPHLLQSALETLRRPGFSFRARAVISGSGEGPHAHRKPPADFFRSTLLELQQSSMFEGPPGRLLFTDDRAALQTRKYHEAGVLIGWSLTQGGPGPQCLHPTLYQLMCGCNPSLEDFNWRDVADVDFQLKLQQLHNCTDAKLLPPSLRDWVLSCGIPSVDSAPPEELPAIYASVVKHYVYHRVAAMISQFTQGLDSCGGLWELVRTHHQAFAAAMTSAEGQPLTAQNVSKLFAVCYSGPDHPLRAAEETTMDHWEKVLALIGEARGGFSLEELLVFVTGADGPPPLGLPGSIALRFYSQDADAERPRLPHASAHRPELFLPRGVKGDEELLELLARAVHQALGPAPLQAQAELQVEARGEETSTLQSGSPLQDVSR